MMLWLEKNLKGDPVIWTVLFLLGIISCLVVYSAVGAIAYRSRSYDTEYFIIKHVGLLILAMIAMYFTHRMDYEWFGKLSVVAMFIAIPLLLFAYFYGTKVNDASRWLYIPGTGITFQPSDLAKLGLIAFTATTLSKFQKRMDDPLALLELAKKLLPWVIVICGMIAMTNFSTAALLFLTVVLLAFIGRVPMKLILYGFSILAVIILAFLSIGQRGITTRNRIMTFVSGKEVPFQVQQSYQAIAQGSGLGRGPGNSLQKDFLPEPYSDFIFAIVIEEYGWLGAIIVPFLYMLLLYRGMVTIDKSTNPYAGLLSAGISFSLTIQAMMNMAVAVGLVPVTGQPLPMLSMGGTSLIFTGISFGIILSIGRATNERKNPQNRQSVGNPFGKNVPFSE
jgi:cell division protein FtsW